MAYDSKTYGQSPFGNPLGNSLEDSQAPNEDVESTPVEAGSDKNLKDKSEPADQLQSISTITGVQSVEQLADRLGIGRADSSPENSSTETDTATTTSPSRRKSRASRAKTSSPKTPSKTAKPKQTRKGKTKASSKTAKATAVEPETVDAAIARRFLEEDRNAYLSLLYKTGISGLIWAVLRLVRYQLSERAIAIINIIIHPVLISMLALMGTIGLTFWLRHILKDIALHTQQLGIDAETTDGKNYRPTLEIVGDSLEYNPKLRQRLSRLFSTASILICTLISYVMTSLLLPWE
ncbi:hypothetical protein [cf. Phormidesmis sp. LEGE 11477]|uniref:hypothetical protein n=1 Tax=cf. Phormidesmis sp. LEGE 11477 TaxID=1828680 RepID=UPI00187E8CD3|nr:hypothetical protein [cf. Phormidesmis sp. LEGE 11477]MBE9063253.1 hypothetical protein [cf. Phormidesmis sp. LEGE 11477]